MPSCQYLGKCDYLDTRAAYVCHNSTCQGEGKSLSRMGWQRSAPISHISELSHLPNLLIGPIRKSCEKNWKKSMKHNYQTFVEDLSDKVKKNPKRFWSFFMRRPKQKLYQIFLMMVFQNTVIQLLKLIYLTNIFNLFLIRIFLLPTLTFKIREPKR